MRWKAAKASGEGGVCRQPETSVLLGALLGNWRGRGLEMARCLGARLAQHFLLANSGARDRYRNRGQCV